MPRRQGLAAPGRPGAARLTRLRPARTKGRASAHADSLEAELNGMAQASVIVVGNEKGGAGKSTIAIHTAIALMHGGARVAALDLDLRQQTMGHFFANRRAWLAANMAAAPMPLDDRLGAGLAGL